MKPVPKSEPVPDNDTELPDSAGAEHDTAGAEDHTAGAEDHTARPEHNSAGPEHDRAGPVSSRRKDGRARPVSRPSESSAGPASTGPKDHAVRPADKPEHETTGPKHETTGPGRETTGPDDDTMEAEHETTGPERDTSAPELNRSVPARNTGVERFFERCDTWLQQLQDIEARGATSTQLEEMQKALKSVGRELGDEALTETLSKVDKRCKTQVKDKLDKLTNYFKQYADLTGYKATSSKGVINNRGTAGVKRAERQKKRRSSAQRDARKKK